MTWKELAEKILEMSKKNQEKPVMFVYSELGNEYTVDNVYFEIGRNGNPFLS